jgi:hypothetical protein
VSAATYKNPIVCPATYKQQQSIHPHNRQGTPVLQSGKRHGIHPSKKNVMCGSFYNDRLDLSCLGLYLWHDTHACGWTEFKTATQSKPSAIAKYTASRATRNRLIELVGGGTSPKRLSVRLPSRMGTATAPSGHHLVTPYAALRHGSAQWRNKGKTGLGLQKRVSRGPIVHPRGRPT